MEWIAALCGEFPSENLLIPGNAPKTLVRHLLCHQECQSVLEYMSDLPTQYQPVCDLNLTSRSTCNCAIPCNRMRCRTDMRIHSRNFPSDYQKSLFHPKSS